MDAPGIVYQFHAQDDDLPPYNIIYYHQLDCGPSEGVYVNKKSGEVVVKKIEGRILLCVFAR